MGFYELTLDHAHITSDRARGRESQASRMRPPDVQRNPHTRHLFSLAYSSKSPTGKNRSDKRLTGSAAEGDGAAGWCH